MKTVYALSSTKKYILQETISSRKKESERGRDKEKRKRKRKENVSEREKV